MQACETNFRNLNRDGCWLAFERRGLELLPDGTLQPHALPRLAGGAAPDDGAVPGAPSGVAVDRDGSIFYSDPGNHRVSKIEGCSGEMEPALYLGGPGSQAYELDMPRGLLIPVHRRALYVVDSGNHRVQIYSPDTGALEGTLGAAGETEATGAGSAPGRFDTPWAIASDTQGNVYVVDRGNRRVQKFDRTGMIDPAFWQHMASAGLVSEPADIAVSDGQDDTRIYVLDSRARTIFLFDREGHALPWRISGSLDAPMGLAVTADSLYVGDNGPRRLLRFRLEGTAGELIGQASGFAGPVGALAVDHAGNLLVHGGGSAKPVKLDARGGYSSGGALWGGPFRIDCPELGWRRVHASARIPPRGAHLQFFYHLASGESPPPSPPAPGDTFPPEWREVAPDVADFSTSGDSTQSLWIGAHFSSDGSAAASLSQLRVELDRETYLDALPAIYRERSACGDFFDRFLALFESFFQEVEEEIRGLPALFDARSAPNEVLPWLASWLALDLDDRWPEHVRREAIEHAFERHGRSGTPRGLREAIEREAGIRVVIEEPILDAGWWALPGQGDGGCPGDSPAWSDAGDSVLGWTTRLASADAQGAVAGTTATLDRSHLIAGDELGVPLFEEVAHQFVVLIYPADAGCPGTLDQVREIVEREKPAHTSYSLCVIPPASRVGLQARLGVDAIVSGERSPTRLGRREAGGAAMVLGGQPRGRLGVNSHIDVSTRL